MNSSITAMENDNDRGRDMKRRQGSARSPHSTDPCSQTGTPSPYHAQTGQNCPCAPVSSQPRASPPPMSAEMKTSKRRNVRQPAYGRARWPGWASTLTNLTINDPAAAGDFPGSYGIKSGVNPHRKMGDSPLVGADARP